MNIQGDRIKLRAIEVSDSNILMNLMNDRNIEHMLGGWSFPVSNIDQENWIYNLSNDKSTLRCMIEIIDSQKTIGTAILTDIDYKNGNAEVHIKLIPSSEGKGYGTDAIHLLTSYAFEELRLKCLYSKIVSYNVNSIKLFEKCGFIQEGILRNRIFKKSEFHDIYSFSKIAGE